MIKLTDKSKQGENRCILKQGDLDEARENTAV